MFIIYTKYPKCYKCKYYSIITKKCKRKDKVVNKYMHCRMYVYEDGRIGVFDPTGKKLLNKKKKTRV